MSPLLPLPTPSERALAAVVTFTVELLCMAGCLVARLGLAADIAVCFL